MRRRPPRVSALLVVLAVAGTAHAQRPVLQGEATFGVPGGEILVHYATTGADLAGLDFVTEVAETAEAALVHFIELGFMRPLDDGVLGGDGRIDLYLANLNSSDGSAGVDSCEGERCIGYSVSENDFAMFSYPSITEGIRSVVPHELFHLIQNAYSVAQSSSWTEGTAVWAVENLYGDGNSDFERFLPAFVPRSFRPFERAVGGFDSYSYGAALWPYFLEHRFGVDAVVAAWEACETAPFLEAIDSVLKPLGSSTDAAWVEFTRWNWFTGARAAGGRYPAQANAAAWPVVPVEPAIAATGQIFVEGLSARYVPITVAARSQLRVSPTGGIQVAGWAVRDGEGFDKGVELQAGATGLVTTLAAGSYTLVVTGLTRNKITTAVDIALEPAPPSDEGDDGGGCSAASGSQPAVLLVMAALLLRRRSRMTRSVSMTRPVED